MFASADIVELKVMKAKRKSMVMMFVSLLLLGLTFATSPVFGRSQDKRNVANYPSIQDAVDSLPQSGGTVFIPRGIYVISTPIRVPSNVVMVGEGFETLLKLADGANCNVIENMHFDEWVDENIVIRDMQIDGNREHQTAPCSGVWLQRATGSIIEYVWFHSFPLPYGWISCSIRLMQSPSTIIRHNIVENNSYTGVFLGWSDNCVISHNYVSRSHRGIYLRNSDSCRVKKNVVINCDEGIRIYYDASNNRIIGNYVEGSSEEGIVITRAECENNFVVGNYLVNNRINIDDKGTNTKMPHNRLS